MENALVLHDAITQTQAHSDTSNRYAFVPTTKPLAVLADHGWFPSKIQISGARSESKQGFQKHLIRLSHKDSPDPRKGTNPSELRMLARSHTFLTPGEGAEFPEIILVNDHCGTSSFKLMLGIFRLACWNGLIVGENVSSFAIRHTGYADQKVENAIQELVTFTPKVLNNLEAFKTLRLERPEQEAFAKAAIELRYGEDYTVEPARMIRPIRQADKEPTLWNTFNIIQENVIKGGVPARNNETNKLRRSNAVKAIDQDVKINRALWTLTEEMAKLKGVTIQ